MCFLAPSGSENADVRDADRAWIHQAIARIEADYNRSADTHLIKVDLPIPGIHLYLKDESSHPTGSLKHRLARSLMLYALCNGRVGPRTTLIEASSGSTAVSEAYFARLIGSRFIAVVPRSTSSEKVRMIEDQGGEVFFVDGPKEVYGAAERLAAETGGYYLDQFTFAERATDWRGNNNIAESLFRQMSAEPAPVPSWLVCSAGTGGTSATLGRYIRYRRFDTRLCVADPESSVFHRHFVDPSVMELDCPGPGIEGIGRPRVEPSFLPELVDCMIAVPNAASLAAMRAISDVIRKPCGGSTGTNIWATARIISRMMARGETGSVVTLLCDSGDRYRSTYYDETWIATQGLDLAAARAEIDDFLLKGVPLSE
ncbi:cysteine synthase A [Pseudoxanthobacter soli DSM 19599]|uniref:L-cysteine desulfhydrase Cds1 n=1 Tax=Pseudoxanthobacter soli DSM 19599 TaxID=1123029 RepID=A0A1M7Z6E1_9HYPH|nr:cysteine synthase A [Pseudoxanthobacter soli DSM 19599]